VLALLRGCGVLGVQWAEVLSADALSAFEEAGLENDEVRIRLLYRSRALLICCGLKSLVGCKDAPLASCGWRHDL